LARIATVLASVVFVLVALDDILGPVGDSTGATVYGVSATVGVALVAASTLLRKRGTSMVAKIATAVLVVWTVPATLLAVFIVLLMGAI
jgi:hypothetical protein